MNITIDSGSGFCFGVEKAIEVAEQELSDSGHLYSLGQIVHNEEEISRLSSKGMETINHSYLTKASNAKVLIRAHGEPPETYKIAKDNNLKIIDATCPIVIKLQKRVKRAYDEMEKAGGQVAIFGKKNHPEVVGLAGQTGYMAIILENIEDARNMNFEKPLRLFSQTTKSLQQYEELVSFFRDKYEEQNNSGDFIHYNTVCRLVSGRADDLKEFCSNNDIIIFVSGKNSSNGKYLYNICKLANDKSYHVSSPAELVKEWFNDVQSVGISGATSTPEWLMEKVADKIRKISLH